MMEEPGPLFAALPGRLSFIPASSADGAVIADFGADSPQPNDGPRRLDNGS